MLKQVLNGIELNAEDLLRLESFQIEYLPDRVPQKEFSTLLRGYGFVKRFLMSKHPPIESSRIIEWSNLGLTLEEGVRSTRESCKKYH